MIRYWRLGNPVSAQSLTYAAAMLRKLAKFTFWLGLFGLFLTFAAYSSGSPRADLLLGSLLVVWLSWRVLRRPQPRFEASRRFRTLRRLGLIGDDEPPEDHPT